MIEPRPFPSVADLMRRKASLAETHLIVRKWSMANGKSARSAG